MRILFQMPYPGYLRIYGSTIRELAERGNEVLIAYDAGEKRRDPSAMAIEETPGVRVVKRVPLRRGRLARPVRDLRMAADYVRYLDPRFRGAQTLRRRMEKYLTLELRPLTWAPVVPAPLVRLLLRALRVPERFVPEAPAIVTFLSRHAPDCVVVTPLLGRGTSGARQPDTVTAARYLGIPVGCAVTSWDHLTSKGVIKGDPDRVMVWNAAQRAEAIELHGVEPKRIDVTGAQLFDHWFERRPSCSREELCRAVGLPADRPYLLYVGSSPNIAPAAREVAFVRRWVEALRASDDAALREAAVLVRPHPGNVSDWAGVDLSGLGAVAVSPRTRPSIPMTEDDLAHYYDCLHFSAAVTGINTTAMIEAAICERPVHTVRTEGFEDTQEGTLHFQLLLPPEGGAVRSAEGMEEHLRQLGEAMAEPERMAASARGFVESFVRPHGLDRPATPIAADAIERLGRLGEFIHPISAQRRKRRVQRRRRHMRKSIVRSAWQPAARDQERVSSIYERSYDEDNAAYARSRDERRDIFMLDGRPLYTDGWFPVRAYSDLFVETFQRLGAESVLEVGSGRGTNLALLAMRQPELRLSGLELTRRGVENSRRLAADPPDRHVNAAGLRELDERRREALAAVEFVQGTALEMPFEDGAFDVSFTCLVLEQLPDEWPRVLREMRRVTRRHCVFLEPFADANPPLGRAYLRALDYFRARYGEFAAHGLEPVSFTTDIPQKSRFRTGLLVTRVLEPAARNGQPGGAQRRDVAPLA